MALIGAPQNPGIGGPGSAFVFRRSGAVWSEEQIWTGSFSGSRFGYSVALGLDVAVVGELQTQTAHLFRREAGVWVNEEQLIGTVCGAGFHSSVALAGDVAFLSDSESAPDCETETFGAVSFYDIPLCGNGALALSEACDDGNTASGDGCSAICQLEPCNDGADNDGDALVDFPADPGCQNADGIENPKCQNGLDDDGDAKIDFDGGAAANGGVPLASADPQCTVAWKTKEAAPPCGLGAELALLAGVAAAYCRRARFA